MLQMSKKKRFVLNTKLLPWGKKKAHRALRRTPGYRFGSGGGRRGEKLWWWSVGRGRGVGKLWASREFPESKRKWLAKGGNVLGVPPT